MRKNVLIQAAAMGVAGLLLACSGNGSSSSGPGGGGSSSGGSSGSSSSGTGGSSGSSSSGTGGTAGNDVCAELPAMIDAYKAAHPGNNGADADINQKTPAEIAADPDAQQLMALCGADQRPVLPGLAWEYGGSDHAWIHPEASAPGYCVYTPVTPSTAHWSYDMTADHVEADVSILCPDQNPCKSETGADQVMACLGDDTNIEILVDTASYNDAMDVGLDISEASTDLYLLEPGSGRVHLYTGL